MFDHPPNTATDSFPALAALTTTQGCRLSLWLPRMNSLAHWSNTAKTTRVGSRAARWRTLRNSFPLSRKGDAHPFLTFPRQWPQVAPEGLKSGATTAASITGLQFRSLEHKPRIGLQHPDDWPRRAAQFPTLFSEYAKSWIECVAFQFFVSFIDSKLADRHHVLTFSSYYPVFPFCHRRHNQIKTTLDSADKFPFWRFLKSYDFEGSRKAPKYNYLVTRTARPRYMHRRN